MLTHYVRLIAFALGLLVGIQVPGFVDQYQKRVSAHQIEAVRALAGFQQTANSYFAGSVEALIQHHATSSDASFRDEAKTIRRLYDRVTELNGELAALGGSLLGRIVHVATHPLRDILAETRAEYSYTVPLDPPAIGCGVIGAALLALFVDALVGLLSLVLTAGVHRRRHARGH